MASMQLLTAEIKETLPALYATEGVSLANKQWVVKFFNPMGAGTWYICEGDEQEDGDWRLFGYCDLGFDCPELGYVMLSELESVQLPFGMSIERDIFFDNPTTLSL